MGCRRIMVPLDGTEYAERALPLAVECARLSGAELIGLSVIPGRRRNQPEIDLTSGAPTLPDNDEVRMRAAYLRGLRSSLSERVSSIKVLLATGDPSQQVLRVASTSRPDLIVMATHGRSGLARGFLGSVTDATITRARIPVLVIRGDTVSAAARPRVSMVHVAIDGSELADGAIPAARMIAETFGCPLGLVTVVDENCSEFDVSQVLTHLSQQAGLLRQGGAEPQTTVVRGRVGEELLRLASAGDDPLIALTTHGRRGFNRAVRGSVADRLIREAPSPILVQCPGAITRLGSPGE